MRNLASPDKKNLINLRKKILDLALAHVTGHPDSHGSWRCSLVSFASFMMLVAPAMRLNHFIILILSLGTCVAENAPLDTWLKRQLSINSLDSEFTQERKLPALKNPVSTPGRLSFSKPDKIRWQLGNPFETLAIADGKILTLIDAATKSARQTDVNSPQAARFSLLSGKAFQSPEIFYQTFEVIESRVAAGIHQYTLKAKDRRLRSQIPWIFLDIDPAKNELRALEIELQDQSRLRTVFHHPRFDAKLDEALFRPDLAGYLLK